MIPAQGSVKAPRGSNISPKEGKCEYSLCVVTCTLMLLRRLLCNHCRTGLVSVHETNQDSHLFAFSLVMLGNYSDFFDQHPQCVSQRHGRWNSVRLCDNLCTFGSSQLCIHTGDNNAEYTKLVRNHP